MRSVSFSVPGNPRGKGRPRFRKMTVRGREIVSTYTDDKTVTYERRVRIFAQTAFGAAPLDGPVAVEIAAYFECPKSHRRKRKPRGERLHTSRPDLDNVVKALLDGMDGVAFADDAQVAELAASKWIAAQGVEPRVEITVRELAQKERTLLDGHRAVSGD